jgi:hypothetical protein
MQLWLALHYFGRLSPVEGDSGGLSLEELIREECNRHLVNTSRGPVAELSYWRLLTEKARNDTVTHPITTVSPDLTEVYHL